MTGLNLYTSNRLEKLARLLGEAARAPLASALAPEIVVVQSRGMARWLRLQLAQQHGICSNYEFPFPRALSHRVFRAVLPELPELPPAEPDALTWRILRQLPELVRQPGFEPLKNYLAGPADARKPFQIAQRIADLFDQYLIFRPEFIREWEAGGGDHWQARLWREIRSDLPAEHPAALQAMFIEKIAALNNPPANLPERVAIFGVSALPPFYLEIFSALARHVAVNLFLLEPCREFWGYISSEREQAKALRRAGKKSADAGALHLETGNRLLASMGQLGRDFLVLVEECGDWRETDENHFSEPGKTTLLASLQSDILNLRDRGANGSPRQTVATTDTSVQIHSCHSPVRELEVLHDQLLDWFARDPALTPRDVLVMIPEIELYAPLIHAVFGAPEDERQRIPFSVADRAARHRSQLLANFLALLNLPGSRLGTGAVLALLESPPVRKKFGLAEADLERVRHWIEEVRIRWGQDAAQRAGLGLPAWPENSWRHGLDQLLLGYGLGGADQKTFAGILPFADIEGDAAEVLGKFAEFLEKLFAARRELEISRSPGEWSKLFHRLLADFFTPEAGDETALQTLQSSLEKLARVPAAAGFTSPVELAVVLEQLNRDLGDDPFDAGYLTGGVTFCALKPMRSIPAKIICLLGLNDRDFPRTSPRLSFDLMAEKPRRGDRSSREDDRYLFLETLLSARDRLYISYVGQSIKDNSPAPPSVLVGELKDYIAQGFELPEKNLLADLVETKHRLQAFSREYFTGGRLFSFSRDNLQASRAVQPQRTPPAPLLAAPLAEPEPERRRLTLPALADFFCQPARKLAEQRLGLKLQESGRVLAEREPFTLEALDRYQLKNELLELKLSGATGDANRAAVRASGRLPAGRTGDASYGQLTCEVEAFFRELKKFHPGKFLPPVPLEFSAGEFSVTGQFHRVTPAGLLFYRPAKIKAKDLLRAWIEHLLWNATGGSPSPAVVVATDAVWKLSPVADAPAQLEKLLALYWRGLSEPLKFFPESSFAFATADFKLRTGTSGRSKKTPADCALEKWAGSEFSKFTPESADAYFDLFFRNAAPLDEDFQRLARAVFDPLLASAVEEKL